MRDSPVSNSHSPPLTKNACRDVHNKARSLVAISFVASSPGFLSLDISRLWSHSPFSISRAPAQHHTHEDHLHQKNCQQHILKHPIRRRRSQEFICFDGSLAPARGKVRLRLGRRIAWVRLRSLRNGSLFDEQIHEDTHRYQMGFLVHGTIPLLSIHGESTASAPSITTLFCAK